MHIYLSQLVLSSSAPLNIWLKLGPAQEVNDLPYSYSATGPRPETFLIKGIRNLLIAQPPPTLRKPQFPDSRDHVPLPLGYTVGLLPPNASPGLLGPPPTRLKPLNHL